MDILHQRRDDRGDMTDMSSVPSVNTCKKISSTPRLEVTEVDSPPFSHDFVDLFEKLNLGVSERVFQYQSPDISYYLENITNIKDIVPDWQHDEIEEIVVMSAKHPSTIQEVKLEKGHGIFSAGLSDFSFDVLDLGVKNYDSRVMYQMCVRRDTGLIYSMKRTKTTLGSPPREKLILEALTERRVPFVSHLRWVIQDGDQMCLVTDYYPKGNLFEYVHQYGALGPLRTVFYASELVVAISSMHSIGIVHQGLDPKNITFDSEGHLVVSDFSQADLSCSTETLQTIAHTNQCIMAEYMAPELLLAWVRNYAADCWSFGMLVYFMLFGAHPFERESGEDKGWIYDKIVGSPIPLESLRLISPTARDLILKCLERNPAVRWTMEKVKGHPYFALVDWKVVSQKRLQAPTFPIDIPKRVIERRRLSLSKAVPDSTLRFSSSSVSLLRRHSVNSIKAVHKNIPVVSEKSTLKIAIPSIVTEVDEPSSECETNGHCDEPTGPHKQIEDVSKAELMALFWDNIDKAGCSVSESSQEFGELDTQPNKVPKLRKHHSSIHPRHRFLNLSTTSFQVKLRRKPRSTGALRDSTAKEVEQILNLPTGIHQIGSGIGFTHNMPAEVSSNLSVCSFAPPCSHSIFQGSFSIKNLRRGLWRPSSRKTNVQPISEAGSDDDLAPVVSGNAKSPANEPTRPQRNREAGNGSFIRDMYQSPSWITSPPDSLPSPMALVTDSENSNTASPLTESEPLTPGTLVNVVTIPDENEANISTLKDFGLGYDLPDVRLPFSPDSTLRLVPQNSLRLSGVTSLFYQGSEV